MEESKSQQIVEEAAKSKVDSGEMRLDSMSPDTFEETESSRIADLDAKNLQVKDIAGEIAIKIEKGENL